MFGYHKHHIVPKHDGGPYHSVGSDDPSNLVMLTRLEHTEAHRLLKEQTGCLKCRLAWLLMSCMTDEADAVRCELARSPDARAKQSAYAMGNKHRLGHMHTPETRAKISAANMGNKNSLGCKASLETRIKLSAFQAGRTKSPETRARMSAVSMGRPKSPEARANMRLGWIKRRTVNSLEAL